MNTHTNTAERHAPEHQAPDHHTPDTPDTDLHAAEAVFRALRDPDADLVESAAALGIPLVEFLAVAESPPVMRAIEALEKLSQLRSRVLLACAAHSAIATLDRIASADPETPAARESCRKAASQILRMRDKAEAASASEHPHPLPIAHSPLPKAARSPLPEGAHSPLPYGAQSPSPTHARDHLSRLHAPGSAPSDAAFAAPAAPA